MNNKETIRDLEERFNEFLDEVAKPWEFGGATYPASQVLQDVDPIYYHQEFLSWADAEGIDLEEVES